MLTAPCPLSFFELDERLGTGVVGRCDAPDPPHGARSRMTDARPTAREAGFQLSAQISEPGQEKRCDRTAHLSSDESGHGARLADEQQEEPRQTGQQCRASR
jgi:hypothetical protein